MSKKPGRVIQKADIVSQNSSNMWHKVANVCLLLLLRHSVTKSDTLRNQTEVNFSGIAQFPNDNINDHKIATLPLLKLVLAFRFTVPHSPKISHLDERRWKARSRICPAACRVAQRRTRR